MEIPRVDFDFSDPAVISDPLPLYEQVRAAGRVVWNGTVRAWIVPGYDDCFEVLSDTRGEHFGMVGARYPQATFWFNAPNMIIADGAEHRRLRHGLAPFFTPTATERRWERRVREVVEAFLAPLATGGSFDLREFTKVPIVIVAELLGIPEERHDDFRRWSEIVTGNVAYGNERPETRRMMDEALAELNVYIVKEIERHRREQFDDVLTVMVNMPDWTEAEIVSSAVNLLLAGYETTARLQGVCLTALEQHPDQRRLVAENLSLVPQAIEEVLRWVGVAQALARVVVRDTTMGGVELKDGDIVHPFLAAANRDPARWPTPHRFDVLRNFKPNLGFGGGPHICIGAPLARLEVRIALEALLRIAPEYHLRDVEFANSFFVRGPDKGVIEAGPATASR